MTYLRTYKKGCTYYKNIKLLGIRRVKILNLNFLYYLPSMKVEKKTDKNLAN